MSVLKVYTRVWSHDYAPAVSFFTKLTGTAPAFEFSGGVLKQAYIGSFLLLVGAEEVIAETREASSVTFVDDLEAAIADVEAAGGRIINGPHNPGYAEFAHVQLPDGSVIGFGQITDAVIREKLLG